MFENCKEDKKKEIRKRERKNTVRVKIRAALVNLSKLNSFVSGTIEIGGRREMNFIFVFELGKFMSFFSLLC